MISCVRKIRQGSAGILLQSPIWKQGTGEKSAKLLGPSLAFKRPGDCRTPAVYNLDKLNQRGAWWRVRKIINGGTPGEPAAGYITPTPLKHNIFKLTSLLEISLFLVSYLLKELRKWITYTFPFPSKEYFILSVFLYVLSIKNIQPKVTNDLVLLGALIHLSLKTTFSKL